LKLQKLLKACKRYLKNKNIDSPELSAEVIFAHCLNESRLNIILEDRSLSNSQAKEIIKLIKKRGQGVPLAYLLGKKEFYGREFFVDENVLIPRPCTELIIDLCKEKFPLNINLTFVDVGIGCGNIAITLLLEFPNFKGIGIDISKDALQVAKKNAEKFGVQTRLLLIQGNILSAIEDNSIALVVSNPPYLSCELLKKAMREVVEFEPLIALFGGEDGIQIPKYIFDQASRVLKKGGAIFMELDSSQMDSILDYLSYQRCWTDIKIYKDLEQKDRVIAAKLL